MPSSPGTVSKILWHFTGGPRWNEAENRQEKDPKPIADAYAALIGILRSREVRIGGYKEVVNLPKIWSKSTGRGSLVIDSRRKILNTVESASVVCLADIPIMHLDYHSYRYGKIAIGFHRESVLGHGFSPVFYQREYSNILEEMNNFFSFHRMADLSDEDDITVMATKQAFRAMQLLLAHVKSFSDNEFGTIYCEREWRSIRPFNFQYDDISMIALPRCKGDGDYFERFVEEAKTIPLPPTVSIVAWDDLVEH